ncbi:MAG TPA: hypothetical protein VK966_05915, partial [Longimicrobiales bacterium]|nr:hypothetical protein [Longimicrobiales bacterium]
MNGRRPTIGHRVEYALVLLARGLDRVAGPRVSGRVAALLGRFVYRVLRIRRPLVERQLRQAFPDRDDRWIRQTAASSYAHLGREGLSMLRLSRHGAEDVRRAVRVEGLDALRAAMEA